VAQKTALSALRLPRTAWGIAASLAVVAGLLVVISIGAWSATRFHRVSICISCHEIFIDIDEYEPADELSESVEDFKPTTAFEPGLFDVTVGCAECHAYPFEEYRESPHYDNDRGVRPGCLRCHEPHSVRQVLTWKFFYVNQGSLGESPFHAISNSIRDAPKWEELRIQLAGRVRQMMVEEDSVKCKVCHKTDSEWYQKIERHQDVLAKGEKTCVQCHYNLVHADVPWDKPNESSEQQKSE
jgi:nitrate/TMAO reductase-like tetraheme cytochrome c subunit